MMKVSVITPTFNREAYHPRLYDLFKAQTYGDKELVVLDDSPVPSAFFASLEDSSVRYVHIKSGLKLGEKRNRLAELATGELLVHFDDDDYYSSGYINYMIGHLGNADFIKLSAFFLYSEAHDAFAYWDTTTSNDLHFKMQPGHSLDSILMQEFSREQREEWCRQNTVGYGFSCVFRRSVWEQAPFESIDHGEDGRFVEAALRNGFKVKFLADTDGKAMVVRHVANNSAVFPQYLLPRFLMPTIFGEQILSYLGL